MPRRRGVNAHAVAHVAYPDIHPGTVAAIDRRLQHRRIGASHHLNDVPTLVSSAGINDDHVSHRHRVSQGDCRIAGGKVGGKRGRKRDDRDFVAVRELIEGIISIRINCPPNIGVYVTCEEVSIEPPTHCSRVGEHGR